jgi:uncharacterized protein (DUF342 family)
MRAAAEKAGKPWLEELDDDCTMQLFITPDQLTANLKVQLRGDGKDCHPQRIIDFVHKCALSLSPNDAQRLGMIAEAVRGGTTRLVPVANGEAPRPSEREIRWRVSLEPKRLSPTRHGAAVDTHEVSHFVAVAAGDTLCEVHETPGRDGRDVFGAVVPCKAGPAGGASLTTGEGVGYAADGQTVIAQRDGCVSWQAGVLSVIQLLEVKGHVDFKIGNVDFNGQVAIQGDVMPGFNVRATGGVKVGGTVERASIEAGEGITVSGGVAGRHLATLKAGGAIEARYLHMIAVESGDDVVIHTECLESDVTAGKDVLAERGAIIGGVVRARGNVRAGMVGSELGVPTTIIAGRDNEAQKELQEAKRACERLHEQMVNDEHAISHYACGGMATLSPAKRQMVEVLRVQLAERSAALVAQTQRVADLKADFAERGGTVTVMQRVFANVTIRIGEFSRTVAAEQAGPLVFYPDVHKGTLEVRSK